MSLRTVDVDLNRVEGDLAFEVDLEDKRIVDARCIGTLYRGFEQLLIGRAPKDGLVITPRVCGICGTAHLYCAALALESAGGFAVPPQATLIRNLCLMAENVQSDIRQTFLFFVPDFLHTRYADHALAAEVTRAFAPMTGKVVRSALGISRQVLGVVALFGGQWPHSSYMVPGGVTRPATAKDLVECHGMVDAAIEWFEDVAIGGSMDTWLALESADRFDAWLASADGGASALGLLTRFCQSVGIDRIGRGVDAFISGGAYHKADAPRGGADARYMPGGFYDGGTGHCEPFDQRLVSEEVRHSWYRPYPGGRHPYEGETVPDYSADDDRYTWAKAPRYGDRVVETGPLAELLTGGDALMRDLLATRGGSAWLRQFARLRRTAHALKWMKHHLDALAPLLGSPHILPPDESALQSGRGHGLVQAARGTLGHWIELTDGKISRYQIVTPTAWNASPKDGAGRHGHWEQSVIGLELADPDDPLELGHIVRSHDPCLVCTVHFAGAGKSIRYGV
ncbi:nickel-dependent hydrogenase large subunit [Nitrogeniibacter mangrovi]|uniref:Nickel-dependent hydrogenase large subunit n=1 Tax=Nitrogeniibacter mangrovi TaxID=2016596 RepID=A0A6C1B265_9RHOO|nr:nickel-dependent hydrogenase large subunit [Nitrogeniibacter mangrovi]QID17463.1 nickel-dependent hydrogenase large subunit [Nitrogeniibacter mangrovi]